MLSKLTGSSPPFTLRLIKGSKVKSLKISILRCKSSKSSSGAGSLLINLIDSWFILIVGEKGCHADSTSRFINCILIVFLVYFSIDHSIIALLDISKLNSIIREDAPINRLKDFSIADFRITS